MNIGEIKIGMEVVITKIDQTDASFTSGSSMRDMIGHTYIVDHVNTDNNEIRVGGWSWHSDDLDQLDYEIGDEPSEAMTQQKTLFNPNELII